MQIDPSSTVELASAGIEAEAEFVQDVLGLGQEVVSQIQDSQQKANEANYEVEINKLKNTLTEQRAERIDLNDIEYNNEVVKPELDKFYNNWTETRKGLNYNYFNNLWNEDKLSIETIYEKEATNYRIEQFEVDQLSLADDHYKNDRIDEGDSVVDSIQTLSPKEKKNKKAEFAYNYILNKINQSKDQDEIRQSIAHNISGRLSANQAYDLELRARYRMENIIQNIYSPTIKQTKELLKTNNTRNIKE